MTIRVTRQDARFDTLKTGHNLRFPATDSDAADRILLCASPEETAAALQQVVSAGLRPTVRSGGHCYEDFVSRNPHGAILDLSLQNTVDQDRDSGAYRVAPGTMLGDVYQALYRRYGLTLPAGSCYMVGAGGHISGGGYGLLSRLHGLTSDWLTSVDILTVDAQGKVIPLRVDRHTEPDLFRACRGAGNGNFGIITSFRFDKLPVAPREVIEVSLNFEWQGMSEETFARLLATYGDYWEGRGKDPDTWGLFAIFDITSATNGHFGMHVQFCQPDGTVTDRSVLHEFLERFAGFQPAVLPPVRNLGRIPSARDGSTHSSTLPYAGSTRTWFDATIGSGASGGRTRAKYKSAYMKRSFLPAEANAIYRFFTAPDLRSQGVSLAIDSYGGAVNRPELIAQTAIAQRASVMKLQWMCFWSNPYDDAAHLRAMEDFYTAVYTGDHVDADHQGTPWGDRYEGCYMNYPDRDMLRYSYWPQLYYGQDGLYPFLQEVKRRYDPNNIFHSSMSVQA